jgi:hypothetical protein
VLLFSLLLRTAGECRIDRLDANAMVVGDQVALGRSGHARNRLGLKLMGGHLFALLAVNWPFTPFFNSDKLMSELV